MSRPRRFLPIALIGAAVIAVTLLILVYTRQLSTSFGDVQVDTQARAIMGAMVAYSQNFGNAFPPPDQAASLLVSNGLLAPELLHLPRVPVGQASFFLVTPPTPARWENSFTEYHPILFTNPAATSDGSIIVFGNDNFGNSLDPAAAAKFIAEFAPRSHPLK